jgi:hypothetical protein
MSAALTLPVGLLGGCHCGNIRVDFMSLKAAAELPLRVCGCSFCRAHGARTTVDPDGRLGLRFLDEGGVSRYRFGHKTADFLVCRQCGVYVAAVMAQGQGLFGTLNVNVLDVREVFRQAVAAVDYEGEQAQDRMARRVASWTPTKVGR